MDFKKTALKICFALLVVAMGIIFLLDGLNVCLDGAMKYWYLSVIALFAAMSLAMAVVRKAPLYYIFAFTLLGLFLALELPLSVIGLGYSKTWPLITMFMGTGIMVSQVVGSGVRFSFKGGMILATISAVVLAGLITDTIMLVIPLILIVSGIIGAIYSYIRGVNKRKKDDDIYVTPSVNKKDEEK